MINQSEKELSKIVIDQIAAQGLGRPKKGHVVSSESQIYHDLNIYGHDFYELVRWMHEEFGVQAMSGFEGYAPSEDPFHPFRVIGRKLLSLAGPQYCSLRVVDIAHIITEGKWP